MFNGGGRRSVGRDGEVMVCDQEHKGEEGTAASHKEHFCSIDINVGLRAQAGSRWGIPRSSAGWAGPHGPAWHCAVLVLPIAAQKQAKNSGVGKGKELPIR